MKEMVIEMLVKMIWIIQGIIGLLPEGRELVTL